MRKHDNNRLYFTNVFRLDAAVFNLQKGTIIVFDDQNHVYTASPLMEKMINLDSKHNKVRFNKDGFLYRDGFSQLIQIRYPDELEKDSEWARQITNAPKTLIQTSIDPKKN